MLATSSSGATETRPINKSQKPKLLCFMLYLYSITIAVGTKDFGDMVDDEVDDESHDNISATTSADTKNIIA